MSMVPSRRWVQGGKDIPPHSPQGCTRTSVSPRACPLHEIGAVAQDVAPPLEVQIVTVFSSEWRESAPRRGLE